MDTKLRDKDGNLEQFTIRLKESGKHFRCPCGCNVFHKPDVRDLELYECNACGNRYKAK